MAIICSKKYSTELLTFNKATMTFLVEASTLSGQGETFGRVYDDACDLGLVLRSHITGVETVFTLLETDRDADGDVTSWKLQAVGFGPVPLRLVVLND